MRLQASEKNLNAKNIRELQSLPPKESFKFIVTGDSQRFYEELEAFVASVNQRDDISFVVINGDLTDFGQDKEFKWINERLARLKIPYVAVIGNHDMLGNGHLIFNQMFGADNFSFDYSGCKFICLNTNSREKGFNGTVPDIPWLKRQLSDLSSYRNAFVISHVPPFNNDFDSKLSEPYAAALAESGKVHLSIHSHEHHYSVSKPYHDGLTYLVTGAVKKKHYALISVNGDDYEIERVEY
jgi:Icc-related predicted phosphoesterase